MRKSNSYLELLEESIKLNKLFIKSESVFIRFLSKRLRQPIYRVGGENFFINYWNGKDYGYGIRYVVMKPKLMSFRINWTLKYKALSPTSIDVFLTTQYKPSYRLNIESIGMGSIAMLLGDILYTREFLKEDIPIIIEGDDSIIQNEIKLPKTKTVESILRKKQDKESVILDLYRLGYSPKEVSAFVNVPIEFAEYILMENYDIFGVIENPKNRRVEIINVVRGRPEKQEIPTNKENVKILNKWMDTNVRMKNIFDNVINEIKNMLSDNNHSLIVTGVDENNLRSLFMSHLSKLSNVSNSINTVDCVNFTYTDLIKLLWDTRNNTKSINVLYGVERLFKDKSFESVLTSICENKKIRTVVVEDSKMKELEDLGVKNKFEYKSNIVLVSDITPEFATNSIRYPIREILLSPNTIINAIRDNILLLQIGTADIDIKTKCLDYLEKISKSYNITFSLFETAVVCYLTDESLFEKLFMPHLNSNLGGVAEF